MVLDTMDVAGVLGRIVGRIDESRVLAEHRATAHYKNK